MKLTITDLKLRQELDRVFVLHWTHFGMLTLSVLTDLVKLESFVFDTVLLVLLITFYRLYYQTVKKLFYTFWTLSIVLIVYLVSSLLFIDLTDVQFYLHLLSLIFVVMEMYILHNPIYYPIVSWWEYDFRYRHDLKIMAECEGLEPLRGRMNDIRRDSAGIRFFEDLEIGTKLSIIHNDKTYVGKTMSKRRYSIGRPWTYGFKFHLENEEEKKAYTELMNEYKNEKDTKVKSKFKKTES
ncbi:MAG: hypothetical protein KC493_05130 [Bacteriovoracaceae bacterium]|nr:hypothetical protein [Bacteriovoracaceae bacterium]